MNKEEKTAISATARLLIDLLKACDDVDYIDEVISSVCDGEVYPAIMEE